MGVVRDDFQVIYQVGKGVSINLFDQLLDKAGLQKQVLAGLLGMDPRTIDNYRKQNRSFAALEGGVVAQVGYLVRLRDGCFWKQGGF